MDTITMWVIGGLVLLGSGILGVLWAYMSRIEDRVTTHNDAGIDKISTELHSDYNGFQTAFTDWMKTMRSEIRKEHDDIWQSIKDSQKIIGQNAVDAERRFATKEDFNGMRNDFNDMRREVNTQIGGVSGQLASVVTMLTQKKE